MLPEPAVGQNPEFLDLCNQPIKITPREEAWVAGKAQQEGTRDLHLVEQISNNKGRSFLARAQALAPTIAGAARQGSTMKEGGDNVGGTLYSKNNVAAFKG